MISVNGSVGPLLLDHSDRAQVVAYAGEPEADLHSRGDAARYEVLGYGCPRHVNPSPLDSLLDCRTDFYLVRGELGLFFTRAKPYLESHGVGIGTPTARADLLLHRKVHLNAKCAPALEPQTRRARLAIFFGGGNSNGNWHPGALLVGGHVDSFYLHSKDRDPGVTDCS